MSYQRKVGDWFFQELLVRFNVALHVLPSSLVAAICVLQCIKKEKFREDFMMPIFIQMLLFIY
jgi:hypothetical protein